MGSKGDRHTDLINWICSTFTIEYSGYLAQVHKYDEFRPEPEVKITNGGIKTPDIIAINKEKKIVLVIECKGGLDEQLSQRFNVKFDPKKTRKQINDYSMISYDSLINYFSDLEPSKMDIIIATYPDFLINLKAIEDEINMKGRALWEFNNDEKKILKKNGIHTDSLLDESLSNGIKIPLSHPPPIVWFSRHSNKDHVAAEALCKLLLYAVYNSDFNFTINKIDQILVNETKPPLLWQMSKKERFERWRYMINKSINNKWMRQVKPDVYCFLNVHTHKDLDENAISRTFDTTIRKIRKECGLNE